MEINLSEKTMQRIEQLSPEVKARCCKKLQDGTYSTKVIQCRVLPVLIVDIYEMVDVFGYKDESAVMKAALQEFVRNKNKSREIK